MIKDIVEQLYEIVVSSLLKQKRETLLIKVSDIFIRSSYVEKKVINILNETAY